MKMPKLKMVHSRMVNMSYSIYCYGFNRGKVDGTQLNRREFCHQIKRIHLEGEKLWKKA